MQAGLLITADCLLTTEMRPPLRVPCSSIERIVRPGSSHPALLRAAALAAATELSHSIAQGGHCLLMRLVMPSLEHGRCCCCALP